MFNHPLSNATSSFGEFDSVTGVWKPSEYTGTYGTNGFYLPMQLDNTVEGFNTVTYIGNGSTQNITGVGFSPDLVWIKKRSATEWHALVNVLSGTGKFLRSDSTDGEITDRPNCLTSFDSDGFTVGNEAVTNQSGQSFVAWCWDAGSSTVSNTDGSITSSVRANPAYGFSIVKYTATGTAGTVGHGLGVVPQMIIVKHAGQALTTWPVYTAVVGNTKYLRLNATNAETTDSNSWNNTTPTSTVFSVGNNGADTNNTSGGTTIAYCFAEVEGYSKFGKYTGNGSSDGPFVYLGFRPKFVMVKRYSSGAGTANWVVLDTSRDIYNLAGQALMPNLSNAEYTPASSGYPMDILSNGFKQRGTSVSQNESGSTYIFMAFAESPFKYANAR